MDAESAEVAAYIGRWRPSSVSAEAAAFARDVITRTAPNGRERAKNLLWAAGKLADYAVPLGLEPVPEVLLHPSVTEWFTRCAPGLSGAARRTLRTNLRFIGPAHSGAARAAGLVCLGAGAGLIRGDLRGARGSDVAQRSGGVVVAVRGARPRAVPVLARCHGPLLAAARFAGDGLVCGGISPGRRNLTSRLTASLDGGGGLPPLDTSRLRATWLRDCGQLLGLATVAAAPARKGRRAGLAVRPRDLSCARAVRAVLSAIRLGHDCYQDVTSEIGKYRNTVDRDRHRARKSKSPSSFAHATAKDTATRIAPAVITMANTPA